MPPISTRRPIKRQPDHHKASALKNRRPLTQKKGIREGREREKHSPMETTSGCRRLEEETRSTMSSSLKAPPAASSCSSSMRTRSRSSRETRVWDCLGEGAVLRTARGRAAEAGEGRPKRWWWCRADEAAATTTTTLLLLLLPPAASFGASPSTTGTARAAPFVASGEQHMARKVGKGPPSWRLVREREREKKKRKRASKKNDARKKK